MTGKHTRELSDARLQNVAGGRPKADPTQNGCWLDHYDRWICTSY